ncbi:MAG: FAD-dependent oxidoreductase [Hyphomicrobiales bacterium]|nr:FAD-dependent oxidoreductase [Hyphomicrobiales bacterium]
MSKVVDFDVVVVGAGAAGIAAGRRLAASGLTFTILEARARSGGRAHTEQHAGLPLDLGCGWLHSADRNPLVRLAEEAGFAVDRSTPPWQKQADARGFSAEDQQAYRDAQGAFFERIEAAAREPEDRPASDFLDAQGRWSPLIEAMSTYVNGTDTDRLSVRDFDAYEDTEVNYRVSEGYGALIVRLGASLPVRHSCVVRLIDHGAWPLRVETSDGELRARAVIVTVPTNAIALGTLRFRPALPERVEAAACLPLGLADKLFLALDGAEEFDVGSRLYGATDTSATANYHVRPFGQPVIEAYFGGQFARELETGGMKAFADFAISQIVDTLGSSMRDRLRPLACSSWARDPFALGSYSHALPGHAGARAVLAAPVSERLFFAGEAVSPHFFSTAHGAWQTGEAAAQEALASLAVLPIQRPIL